MINLETVQIVTPRAAIRAKAPRHSVASGPFLIDGKVVHHVGMPWHWGYKGDQQGRRRQRSLGLRRRPQRDHPRGQGFRLPGGKTRGRGKERLNAPDARAIASHGDPARRRASVPRRWRDAGSRRTATTIR